MKIVLPAPSQIPARRANTIQVMKMAQAFTRLGHQVRLLSPGQTPEIPWETLADQLTRQYGLVPEFLQPGLAAAEASPPQEPPLEWLKAQPRWRGYDYALRAVRRARGWRADLLFTRLPQAAALASQLGLATVLEMHDLPQGQAGPWLFRSFLTGRASRRLVVITRRLVEDIARGYALPERAGFVCVAPDGVDLERYQDLPDPPAARQLLGLPAGRFTAGYTGHLYAGRGIELLLQLASQSPDILFLIVGGEPEEVKRLQAEVVQAGLENVQVMGFTPNAELPRYQAACDVLLAPYEERVAASSGGDIARYLSPLKLFEYLACGRPIVCSDLPALREILHPGNAILLPVAEGGGEHRASEWQPAAAWAAALQRLQADAGLRERLASQARREAARYSWEGRAAKILEGL